MYSKIGNYKNALKYNLQALEILEKVLGETHPSYALSLDNIGILYNKVNDYENSLKYHNRAMEIRAKALGKEHPDYAASLCNIGYLYYSMGEYDIALENHLKALEIRRKVLGENHPLYAESLINVGGIYSKMGKNESAMQYYKDALEILGKIVGKEHPDYVRLLSNIGGLYSQMGDISEAIRTNNRATKALRDILASNFSFMTAQEREAYWSASEETLKRSILHSFNNPQDSLAAISSYDTELITKGLLLTSEVNITNIIMESGDTAIISEYSTMKSMQLTLNNELEKPVSERNYDCDSLENEIQKMERRIVEDSKAFGDISHFIRIDWKEVQNSMDDNDVAIEFTNVQRSADSTMYAAIVLTKDMSAPAFVPLFEKKVMQKLIRGVVPVKSDTTGNGERGATLVSNKKRGIYESTGLYETLWQPLEKYFPENPSIYFAPSGMLYQIAVEYAPIDNEHIISDKYKIYRMSSTRFLVLDNPSDQMKNTVLYGGIFYDSDSATMKQESEIYASRSAAYNSFADLNKDEYRESLRYLPGTKAEVDSIAIKLGGYNISTTIYEGSQANEESFKALSGKNISTLHIATHGFFIPTEEKLSGDQSLIQSGLLMSGANYAWQNLPVPEGVEDGILTAKEISFMDLRQTDLVVLSACQTALGEITGEGVFGLQRGFKKAGVHTIIMSLWPVDDNATLLMMTEFYTNLTKGMSKREAFLTAQNKVKTTAGFENPRYWAAFIMLDGNEN